MYITTASSQIEKCKFDDSECVKNKIDFVFANYQHGLAEIGLASLDPIKIDSMEIKQGGNSPIQATMTFKNVRLSGLSNVKTVSVE